MKNNIIFQIIIHLFMFLHKQRFKPCGSKKQTHTFLKHVVVYPDKRKDEKSTTGIWQPEMNPT